MRRRLFNFAAAASLLLGLATVVLWERSYWRTDGFWFWTASGLLELRTQKGKLFLDNEPQRRLDQKPMDTVIKRTESIGASIERLSRELDEADSRWQRDPDRFNEGAADGAAKHIADLRMKLEEPEQQLSVLRYRMLRWVRKPLVISPPINHSMPLYLPLILTAILPSMWILSARLISRRTRHRQRMRECLVCSYNLTGNVSGTCPECGTPVARKAEATA